MAKRFSGGFLGLALASGFFLGSCHPQSDSALEEKQHAFGGKQKNSSGNSYLNVLKSKKDLREAMRLLDSIAERDSIRKSFEKPKPYDPNNPYYFPDYFLDSKWNFFSGDILGSNHWVNYTLEESKRTKRNAIIINKFKYTLYVIKSGQVHSKYPIELGGDPYNDKERRGDMRTPEGFYKLERKLDKGQTAYYKAFLINYPNGWDKDEGRTGENIEIYGCGSGKRGDSGGRNWTRGSIALSNKDMDKIFPLFNEGDIITIVRFTSVDLERKLYEY